MNDLAGLRVLLVEDEGGVALLLEDMLEELGCEVGASVARLSQAVEEAQRAEFDLALLDVNVAGELSFPFAKSLIERGVPIILSTGYGSGGLPPDFEGQVVLTKPFTISDLRVALGSALEPIGRT